MAGLDLYSAQEEILQYLIDSAPDGYQVMEGDVPDAQTIEEVGGVSQPIWVIQFSDMLARSGDGSFGGPQWDGYYSMFRIYSLGSTPRLARKANNVANSIILGKSLPNVSAMGKEWGGGSYAIGEANSRPLAYVLLSAFQFNTNIDDVASVPYTPTP